MITKKKREVFTTEKVPSVTFLNMSNALTIYLLQRDKIIFKKIHFFASLGNCITRIVLEITGQSLKVRQQLVQCYIWWIERKSSNA